MASHTNTSRRAFLRAVPAAVALSAVPAVAMIPGGPASGLLELITAHKLTVKARDEALAEVNRIEALPDYPEYPKIHVGNLRVSGGPDNPYRLEPIYAYGLSQIEQYAPTIMSLFGMSNWEQRRADWIAKKTEQFNREFKQWRDDVEAFGAIRAEVAYDDACDREEEARIALIAYRPATSEESEIKTRYLSKVEPSAADSFAARPDLLAMLIARLSEPAVPLIV